MGRCTPAMLEAGPPVELKLLLMLLAHCAQCPRALDSGHKLMSQYLLMTAKVGLDDLESWGLSTHLLYAGS